MWRVGLLASVLALSQVAGAAPSWPALATPPPAIGGGEGDAAVIVGIERYSVVPPVAGAIRNADAWFSYLTTTLGTPTASVTLLRNNEGTLEKLRKYAAEAAER